MPTGSSSEKDEPVVITDKRKIDRQTDRKPDDQVASPPEQGGEVPAPDENAKLLAERTADLQRLQAEYANYRRRAERERQAAGEVAISRVLVDFLPVLDNLDRARQHGDLTGGLKAVADQLDSIFAKFGLVAFGEAGDSFDPSIHEAVMHGESDDVTEPTCTTVMRPGYKHNDRLLRPAMVGVSDPAVPQQEPEPNESADADSE
jgi:molecular chaperone GrpE